MSLESNPPAPGSWHEQTAAVRETTRGMTQSVHAGPRFGAHLRACFESFGAPHLADCRLTP